jgi:RNA polymerase sigma-70 factor, ECF subfamily
VSPSAMTTDRAVTEDYRLMVQVNAGSVDAFGELYDRYCCRAYRVAWSVCHDEGRAEDAVHEAFISIWKNRACYVSQRGTVAAWLLTAVRYRAIDVARREGRHAGRLTGAHTLDAHSTPGDTADDVVAREDARSLQNLLAELPDAQREVITLAYYGELTHTEIAKALGVPAGTVKGRMRLGLQKLRAGIEKASRTEERPLHVAPMHRGNQMTPGAQNI